MGATNLGGKRGRHWLKRAGGLAKRQEHFVWANAKQGYSETYAILSTRPGLIEADDIAGKVPGSELP